jgi:DNA-binding CsgD family transcriptional regulator
MFVSDARIRVAALLADGLSVAEVARRLGLAYTTVSYHRGRLQSPAQPPVDGSPHEMIVESVLVPVRTREEVRRLLSLGCSRADVARRLGIAKSTVTYHARRFGLEIDARAARRYDCPAIQRYCDAGHTMEECRARFGFCKAAWTGAVRRGGIVARPKAMPIEALLSAPRARHNLKRRLVGAGLLKSACGICGLREWRGTPLTLQLHHVNGDRVDNRLENLTLLCPNCHSQTDSWSGRNPRTRATAARSLAPRPRGEVA